MAGVITRERRSTGIALIVLEAEIACELAMLSASQARYDYFEAKLASRPAMKADRSHLAEQLRARLRKHRKGHVLRLADLHDADFVSRLQIQFGNTPLTGVQARPAISGNARIGS